MTGPEQLRLALVALRDAFQQSIFPDLHSPWAKGNAESILLLLNRLIAEVEVAPTIAAQNIDRLSDLEERLHPLLSVRAHGSEPEIYTLDPLGPLAQIEACVARMQQQLDLEQNRGMLVAGLRDRTLEVTRWFDDTASTLIRMLLQNEASMTEPVTEAEQKDVALNPAELQTKLNAYLVRRFPVLPANVVNTFEVIPGGRAKLTARIGLLPNGQLPGRLVLRLDTAGGFTGTTVAGEFPLLLELFKRGLAVPQPILVEPDPGILGGTFIISMEVLGAGSPGAPFPEERRRQKTSAMGPQYGREVAQFLAKLHAVREFPKMDGGVALNAFSGDPVEMINDSFKLWRSKKRTPLYSLLVDLGFAWLMSRSLPKDRPVGIVHGDFGSHNQLAKDGHLAAVIDWELAHEGDPAEDLGYCRLMLLEDIISWEDFVDEYVAAGGDRRTCDVDAVSFWGVWAFVKHSVIQSVLRDQILGGAPVGIEGVGGHWHFFFRIAQYLARELDLVLRAKTPITE